MNNIAKRLQDKQREYVGKNNQLQQLAASEDLTPEVLANMQTLQTEMQGLETEIKQLQDMAKSVDAANQNAGAMAPDASFRFDSTPGAVKREAARIGGGADVLGFTRNEGDGTLHVYERNGERFVEFDGQGVMTEKVWNAISENDYKRAFRSYMQSGGREERLDSHDRRVLEVGSDTAGGFLVPADYQRRLIERKPAPTQLRGNVTTLTTGSDTVLLPTVDYSGSDNALWPNGMRLTWTGEKPASSTAHRVTEPTFGQISIPIGTAMLSCPLTLNFLEDPFMDPLGWLVDRFGIAVDLTEESEIIQGPGTEGRMTGILTGVDGDRAISSVISGSAAALTADGLINLAYALPEQYDENSRFYFNKRNSEKTIATLKDADNRYLFASGFQDDKLATARPKELLGYPISRTPFMPDQAANAFPVLFGDARGYTLVRRVGFSVKILDQTAYEQNQIVAVGRLRIGGKVTEPWTMFAQKCST